MLRNAIGLLLVLLAGYGAVKALPLLSGPSLSDVTPSDYTTLESGPLVVSGVAHNTEAVFLNGAPVLIDPEGRFSKALWLPSGGSILTLVARDRFGRTVTERRTVHIP